MTCDPLQSLLGLPSYQTLLVLTLKETKCHIVNPKPYNECEERKDYETVSLSYNLFFTSVH